MNNIFSSNTDITILLALVDSNKYNKINFLQNCLNSLKEQTFTNFEFIIFDNINNLDIINLTSNYSFCKYTYLNYNNPVDALNFGFKNFNSKYITFINYNFTFSPNYLYYLKLSLDLNDNSNFIYSSHELISKRKITIHANPKLPVDLILNFPGIISFLIKKSIIEKIGYLDENIYGAENYDYFSRIFLNDSNFLSIDITLCHYNQNILDIENFNYFELEKKIAYKLSTKIDIEKWYPTINLCIDINRAKSIALFDFCLKIINSSIKKAFSEILYKNITNYFLNSYLIYPHNISSLLNYLYFCKKNNINTVNNLKDSDKLYYFDINNYIVINYEHEDIIKNNYLYFNKQSVNINNYLKSIYNTYINISNIQLVLSSKFNYLKEYLIETYNFTDYISNELPTVFFGCYNDVLEILKNHNGTIYIYWIDYDLQIFMKNYIKNNTLSFYKKCLHIANNKYIYDILIKFDLKVFLKETNIYFINNFNYNINSNKILVYTGDYNNNLNPIIYGKPIIDLLITKFQNNNISFILTKDFQINYNDQTNLNDIKLFIKLTEHDNYSNIETYFSLLKIPIINTFNDFDDLVLKINSLL